MLSGGLLLESAFGAAGVSVPLEAESDSMDISTAADLSGTGSGGVLVLVAVAAVLLLTTTVSTLLVVIVVVVVVVVVVLPSAVFSSTLVVVTVSSAAAFFFFSYSSKSRWIKVSSDGGKNFFWSLIETKFVGFG